MTDTICSLPGCGAVVPPERFRCMHRGEHYCCAVHQVENGKRKDREKRRVIWEAGPMVVCRTCGKLFKPPFLPRWQSRVICPECGRLKTYHRDAQRRHKASVKRGVRALRLESRKLRPCLSMKLRGFRSPKCDGQIHNGNWRFCEACNSQFLAHDICGGLDEFNVVETVDIQGALW